MNQTYARLNSNAIISTIIYLYLFFVETIPLKRVERSVPPFMSVNISSLLDMFVYMLGLLYNGLD